MIPENQIEGKTIAQKSATAKMIPEKKIDEFVSRLRDAAGPNLEIFIPSSRT